MKASWIVPALVLLAALACLGSSAPAARDGYGWSMTRLDLDVRVLPDEETFELTGTMRVRLDARSSSRGPDVLINMKNTEAGDPVMRLDSVNCAGADVRILKALRSSGIVQAEVRFERARQRGDEVSIDFAATANGHASQLIVNDEIAIASWTSAWHPFTNPSSTHGLRFAAKVLHAPGRTRLHLPPDWIGIVDGDLVERTRSDSETVEVWETPPGIARGFAAGPFVAATQHVDGRDVRVYMLSKDKPLGPERLARLVADAIAAQEAHLGPFPFGSYGVVEVPEHLPGQRWSAASQQTFIIAVSSNFDHEHGNVPLWGHESAHAWWGNTVASHGPGSSWCGEALAQLGGLLAVEAADGPEGLHEYLSYSRSGFSPFASAAGYFAMVRDGQDAPLSDLKSAPAADDLVDSKGMWVYHMLRRKVGDEIFFDVLRRVIADYTNGSVSMAEMRRRFVAAAPEHELRKFFAQWLDRTGAPMLDVDWYAQQDGSGAILQLAQVQDGQPFAFDLEVDIELADGQRVRERVEVSEKEHAFALETPARPADVTIDPDSKILLWRPGYGPRRAGDFTGEAQAPKEVVDAILGTYRIPEMEREIEVFLRDGALFAQPAKQTAVRLVYREKGTFLVNLPGQRITVHFDLGESPCPSFRAVEEDVEYVATRVGR